MDLKHYLEELLRGTLKSLACGIAFFFGFSGSAYLYAQTSSSWSSGETITAAKLNAIVTDLGTLFSTDSNQNATISGHTSTLSSHTTTISNHESRLGTVEGKALWIKTGSDAYYTAGRVGIGTTTPATSLEIVGEVPAQPDLKINSSDAALDLNGSGAANFSFSRNGTLRWIWAVREDVGGVNDDLKLLRYISPTGSYGGLILQVQNSTGYIGIGTSAPAYPLHVNGTAAGISWVNLSSRSYKKDIKSIPENDTDTMLLTLMKTDLYRYRYRKDYGGKEGDSEKLGFIAEEMPADVLTENGKGVDLYELIAYTIGAMKSQQKQIEKQERLIGEYRARIQRLEKIFSASAGEEGGQKN